MMMISIEHPVRAPEAFWRAIERGLVDLHDWDADRASEHVCRLRAALEAFRSDDEPDLIVHDDLWEIAGDMTGRYLDSFTDEDHRKYAAIVEAFRREWAEEQVAKDGVKSRLVGRASTD